MKASSDQSLATHVGSLPRPDDLIALNRAPQAGEAHDKRANEARLASAMTEVERRQQTLGIDIPNDGEYRKAMGARVTPLWR